MDSSPYSGLAKTPASVALIYAGCAGAWIILSDVALALASDSPTTELWRNIGKGLFFVVASAGFLYVLLQRRITREMAIAQDLVDQQKRFEAATAHNLPFTFAIYDADRRFRYLNAHGLLEAGKPWLEVVGRRDEEVFPLEWVNAYRALLDRAFETRQLQTEVVSMTTPSGRRHFDCRFTPLLNADGTLREVLGVTYDMTAVVRNERRMRQLNHTLAAIGAANSVLVRSTSEAELLQGFCHALVGPAGHRLVWVGQVTPPDSVVRVVASAGEALAYLADAGIRADDTPQGHGPTGTSIRTGVPVVCHDFRTDPQLAPWRERAAKHELRSCVALPLRTAAGVWGSLTVYSNHAHRFDAEEIKLLAELADDLAYGLDALRNKVRLERTLSALGVLQQVVEHSAVIAYVRGLGPDWPVEFVSENVARHGYRAAEFTSGQRSFPSLVHPADWPELVAATELHAAAGPNEFSLEYRVADVQGGLHWVRDSCTVVRSEAGLPVQFRGVLTDVSERKEAEELRRTFEHLVQGTLDAIRDHICVLEEDGTIAYVNDSWRRFAAANPPPPEHADVGGNYFAICRQAQQLQNDAEVSEFLGGAQAVLRGERPEFLMEYACHSPTERRWFVVRVTPFAPGGRPRVAVTHTNITGRKVAEAALRDSEERLRLALKAANQGIWDLNPATGETVVSPEYATMLGYEPGEFRESHAAWTERLHPDDRELVLQGYHEYLAGQRPEFRVEFRQRTKSGQWKWILSAGQLLQRDAAGHPVRMLGTHTDITERKLAETSLKASEAKYFAILNESPVPMALNDSRQRITFLNRAFSQIFGYGREDIPTLADWWPKAYPNPAYRQEVAEGWQAELARAKQTGKSFKPFELKICCKDGTERFALVSATLFPSDDDTHLVTLLDITERRRSEAQMRDAWSYLGAVIDTAPLGIVACDEQGQMQTANEAAAKMLGGTVAQLLQQNFRKLEPWKDAGLLEVAERALAQRRPEQLDTHHTTTFGNEVWLALQFVPFQRGENWHLLALITDRSEQLKATAQLELQAAALAAAANVIVITDPQGEIEWVNDAFTRVTGFSRAEALGKNPRILKSGHHSREFYRQMWQTISAGKVWHGEISNLRKDGTPFEADVTITPVKNAAGQIAHYISIKQDITDKKHLEKLFLRAQRLEGIGLLAGGIAHDLNNVLAPILMGADELKMMTEDAAVQHQLDSIAQSAQRGAGIVKQVLTFARGIEGERVSLQPKHIIKEMVRLARETFPPNLHVQTNVPADLWPVLGDPTQLHQVLLNLSVNARDAMPDGGELNFSARNAQVDPLLAQSYPGAKPGPHVVMRVQDNGMGIPPEVMERIFEPFFTTKELGKGTGLGLSTALGIVRSHGGFVTVESTARKGAAFEVYLPATPEGVVPAPAVQAAPLPLAAGETVLVVDDEADIVQVTCTMLERHGYRVLTATDGTVALLELSRHLGEVKVMVTDILMPFMDGVQLVRAVRRLSPDVKIIAASGALGLPGQRDRTEEVLAMGVKHILHKPFPVEQLLRTVHDVLHPGA